MITLTLCEPSGPIGVWADDRKPIEAEFRDRFDVFVSDDVVTYPSSFHGDSAPAAQEPSQSAEATPPSAFRQPATEPARSAVAASAPVRPALTSSRPLQSPVKRLHQSNTGGQRQMGGVKQTNRFFARRQFA